MRQADAGKLQNILTAVFVHNYNIVTDIWCIQEITDTLKGDGCLNKLRNDKCHEVEWRTEDIKQVGCDKCSCWIQVTAHHYEHKKSCQSHLKKEDKVFICC